MKPYRRKLSSEDADTGTILITKDRWRDFPPPMKEFEVRAGRDRFATRIVAEDCVCVLPQHQHYHLEAGHFVKKLRFRKGDVVEISGGDGAYAIRNGT